MRFQPPPVLASGWEQEPALPGARATGPGVEARFSVLTWSGIQERQVCPSLHKLKST